MGKRIKDVLEGFGGAVLIASAIATPFLKTWRNRWGATVAELNQQLPGDDILPGAVTNSTRAITIETAAADVWPWLVQMGQGRGGMYSYEWLENLIGCDMHNADRIITELQEIEVGDTVWMAPKNKYGGQAYNTIGAIEPNRALVLITLAYGKAKAHSDLLGNGTWAFVLNQLNEHTTRLIVRGRGIKIGGIFQVVMHYLTQSVEFVMERKSLMNIKDRAETQRRAAANKAIPLGR